MGVGGVGGHVEEDLVVSLEVALGEGQEVGLVEVLAVTDVVVGHEDPVVSRTVALLEAVQAAFL